MYAEWQFRFSGTQDYAGKVMEEKKVKSKALTPFYCWKQKCDEKDTGYTEGSCIDESQR